MKIKVRRSTTHQPSLVPMADMLSNLVGIVLFILMFIVLTSSGASMLRYLPMEKKSSARPMNFICYDDKILPMTDDNLFEMKFGFANGGLVSGLTPRKNVGESVSQLNDDHSNFRDILSHANPDNQFVHFIVYPNSLAAYQAASKIARENKFNVGWMPWSLENPTIWTGGCVDDEKNHNVYKPIPL